MTEEHFVPRSLWLLGCTCAAVGVAVCCCCVKLSRELQCEEGECVYLSSKRVCLLWYIWNMNNDISFINSYAYVMVVCVCCRWVAVHTLCCFQRGWLGLHWHSQWWCVQMERPHPPVCHQRSSQCECQKIWCFPKHTRLLLCVPVVISRHKPDLSKMMIWNCVKVVVDICKQLCDLNVVSYRDLYTVCMSVLRAMPQALKMEL